MTPQLVQALQQLLILRLIPSLEQALVFGLVLKLVLVLELVLALELVLFLELVLVLELALVFMVRQLAD